MEIRHVGARSALDASDRVDAPCAGEIADLSLEQEKEAILATVAASGRALEFVDAKFKKDPDVVLAAVTKAGVAFAALDHWRRGGVSR